MKNLTTKFSLSILAMTLTAQAFAEVKTTIMPAGGITVTVQPSTQGSEKFTQTTQSTTYAKSGTFYNANNNQTNYSSSAFSSYSTENYSNYSSYSGSANRDSYDHLIRDAAARHGVDPALIKAIIHTESTFDPYARSRVGAAGLMQLMPATAREMGVWDAYDPAQNIDGGARYLSLLQRQFSNPNHVIAAYNAGPGNVRKYGGIPPFRETRNYVQKVNDRYNNIYSLDASLYSGSGRYSNLAMNTPVGGTTVTQTSKVISSSGVNFATPQNPSVNHADGRVFISSNP